MVRVYDLAHCRAGDKGNTSNIWSWPTARRPGACFASSSRRNG